MLDEANKDNKKKKAKEHDSSKYIETEPTLDEAVAKDAAVITFGRMNPVTVGHEKLVTKVAAEASKRKADPFIFLSHTQDKKKNPLSYDDKIKYAQKAFGSIVKKSPAKTIIQIAQSLSGKYKNLVMVVGSDRVNEFESLLNKYNGKDFNFDSIQVVSAGERDPDADGVSGMSASKMRGFASDNDVTSFAKGLPKRIKADADAIVAAVRKGMNMSESEEIHINEMAEPELDEALNRQQRLQRARAMRKARFKIKRGREKAMKKTASLEVLKKRARKQAINKLKDKFAKQRRYAELSPAEKEVIDKRVEKINKKRIEQMAKKLLPVVKQAERDRRQAKFKKEEVELQEAKKTWKKINSYLLGKETEVYTNDSGYTFGKVDGKWVMVDFDDEIVYKGKSAADMKRYYNSWLSEASCADTKVRKRPHMMMDANNKPKFDGRFRFFKKKADLEESVEDLSFEINDLMEATESFAEDYYKGVPKDKKDDREAHFKRYAEKPGDGADKDSNYKPAPGDFKDGERVKTKLSKHTKKYRDMYGEEMEISEDATAALKKKAEKTGMPLGILRKVYNRGVAAWKSGHRPGTTPEQWGHARVNSFVTKSSGTWGKADADLAAKVRKEEVELEEARSSTLASLDVEEGDKIKFYASKANPRQEATVVGFTRNGKVEVKPKGSNRIVALDWTHEAVFSESVEESRYSALSPKGSRYDRKYSNRLADARARNAKARQEYEAQKRKEREDAAHKERVEAGGGTQMDLKFEGYRNIMTTHDGERFKSKLHATKKAADDHHWKMTKATDKRGKKIYKSIETVKESVELGESSYTGTASKPIRWIVSPVSSKVSNPKKYVNTEVKAKTKLEAMKLGAKEMSMKLLDVKAVPKYSDEAKMVESLEERSTGAQIKTAIGKVINKKNYNAALEYMKKSGKSAADVARMYRGVDARELASMAEGFQDREKRAFKRKEHEAEWKRDQEIERVKKQKASEPHHVYIDGKVWKKDGKPVHFNNKAHANKAALTILKKDPKKQGKVKLVHHAYTERNGGVIKEGLDEVLKPSDDMGTWIKDFQDSDAPQFKGKSKEKKRQMAIAAKLDAERNEEAGAGEEGTDKLVNRYKKDTPNA